MILEILILFSQGIAISFWIYLFFLYRDVIKELHKKVHLQWVESCGLQHKIGDLVIRVNELEKKAK